MAIKIGDLLSTLNQTKLSKDNPALFQFLQRQVEFLKDLAAAGFDDSLLTELQSALSNARVIRLIEPDTAIVPQTRDLVDDLQFQRLVVYKDYQGNAAVNNITLQGTVEGVVNPVINTNFGTYKVYKSSQDGLFHTW